MECTLCYKFQQVNRPGEQVCPACAAVTAPFTRVVEAVTGARKALQGRSRLSCLAGVAYAPAMVEEAEDSALMLRYQDGDVGAFETLYRRHNDTLYRYLLRRCRHPATAEDLFQEVWGKIIKARDSYRPTAQFKTFLYRVAQNCFIDYVRRQQRQAQGADAELDQQAHPGAGPEAHVERSLARERLARALLELPDEQRDAFLLREEAGLNLDQIAAVVGCNRETAKSRLRYAMNKLRNAVGERAENS